MNKKQIWEKYKKMIYKIAHRLKKQYDKEFDELVSEGITAVYNKLSAYDPERASLCTYIYRKAYYGMLDYCLKEKREKPVDIYNPDKDNPFLQKKAPEKYGTWFKNFLAEVSEETKKLLKIICIEAPAELHDEIQPNRPQTSKKFIKNYMVDVEDWTFNEVEESFKEIKQCL